MTHKELIKELRQESPGPLYLFTGPEQLLIRQAVELLKARLVDPAYADFNLTVLDGEEAAPESLFSALETLPFFQERKLIIVKDAPYFKGTQDKLSEAQRERLEGLLDQPSADTVLVFLAPRPINGSGFPRPSAPGADGSASTSWNGRTMRSGCRSRLKPPGSNPRPRS